MSYACRRVPPTYRRSSTQSGTVFLYLYATGDVLVPHPTKPNLWKYLCRLDDQIKLSKGPKVIQKIVLDFYIELSVNRLML